MAKINHELDALRAIADMKIDESTNHEELSALMIAIARTAIARAKQEDLWRKEVQFIEVENPRPDHRIMVKGMEVGAILKTGPREWRIADFSGNKLITVRSLGLAKSWASGKISLEGRKAPWI